MKRGICSTLVVMVAMILSTCAEAAEATEDIYHYQDTTCPLAEPAKNIWVTSSGSTMGMVGWHADPKEMVWFFYGEPGGIEFGDIKPEFTVEETLLDSATGVFVQRGYFHFSGEGVLPAQIAVSDVPLGLPTRVTFPCLDNLGTRNIQVTVSDKYATKVAGLWWGDVVLSILDDGTVVVNAVGIRAKDDDGNIWISVWNSKIEEYVMVKEIK